jgi:uncharacterized membrane protein YoaK (UPF0700 family)
MIHTENVNEVYNKKNIPLWLLSAFKSGFINSVGFLLTGKFVSHVTGFGTQVGIAVGHDEFLFGAELFIIPLAFIMGGVATSFVLDKDYKDGEIPPYWIVQGVITTLLLVLVFLGAADFYSDKVPFDTDENYTFVEFFVIGTLCFVCGLKNSLVTWASWGKIKVTHLTGLSTDIGLNLIRTFYRKQSAPRFKEQRLVNILRLSTFFCFSSGAAVSALLFPSLGFQVLFLPALISLLMTIISIWDVQKHSIKENSKVEFSQI